MELDEVIGRINKLFADKVTELSWSTPTDVLHRIIGDFEIERERIIQLAEEIAVSQFTSDQIIEAFANLILQTTEAIERISTEESLLDLTTSFDSGVSGEAVQQPLLLLVEVEETIRDNINTRIQRIIRATVEEEPTPMLLEALDPGYLARHRPNIEMDREVIAAILEIFSDYTALIDQVNNLIALRERLIEQAIIIDDQGCMAITGVINAIVASMNVPTEERAQRIREILLKVANNNEAAANQAEEIGVTISDITMLRTAANEYIGVRRGHLAGVIAESIEVEDNNLATEEDILVELYQHIIEQSQYNPTSPAIESITTEEITTEHVFEGENAEDIIDKTPEQINEKIYLYLRQVLLGEEGGSEAYIVNYVISIVGTIEEPSSLIGIAHTRIQELLETVSVQYDVFAVEEGGYAVLSISGTPPFLEEDPSLLIPLMEEEEEVRTELGDRRENTPVPSGGDIVGTELDDVQTNYTTLPPPPPPLGSMDNSSIDSWSQRTTPDLPQVIHDFEGSVVVGGLSSSVDKVI